MHSFANIAVTEFALGNPCRKQAEVLAPTRDPLLNFKDAAQYLGKTYRIIKRLVDEGHIKKCPGIDFIRRSELDRYGK
jgi:hypothetical protein